MINRFRKFLFTFINNDDLNFFILNIKDNPISIKLLVFTKLFSYYFYFISILLILDIKPR